MRTVDRAREIIKAAKREPENERITDMRMQISWAMREFEEAGGAPPIGDPADIDE